VSDGFGSTAQESVTIRNGVYYAGTYRVLASVDATHLGVVDATVTRGGRVTVSGFLDGGRFAGAANLQAMGGQNVGINLVIRRKLEPNKSLRLVWASDLSLTAEIVADESVLFSAVGRKAVISPFADGVTYTLFAPHVNVGGNAGGRVTAYAYLNISPQGKAIMRGKLGDGTSFTAASRIQSDGRVPIYTSLQGKTANVLAGFLVPAVLGAQSDTVGFVALVGAGGASIPSYAKNYRDLVPFSGKVFVPGSPEHQPLTFNSLPRRLGLSASLGGLTGVSFPIPVWVGTKGQVSGIIGITRITVNGSTGEFSGAFLPPGRFNTLPFSGILKPDTNEGVGNFRGPTAAGEIRLTPQ
jgi:hypothetical protein